MCYHHNTCIPENVLIFGALSHVRWLHIFNNNIRIHFHFCQWVSAYQSLCGSSQKVPSPSKTSNTKMWKMFCNNFLGFQFTHHISVQCCLNWLVEIILFTLLLWLVARWARSVTAIPGIFLISTECRLWPTSKAKCQSFQWNYIHHIIWILALAVAKWFCFSCRRLHLSYSWAQFHNKIVSKIVHILYYPNVRERTCEWQECIQMHQICHVTGGQINGFTENTDIFSIAIAHFR